MWEGDSNSMKNIICQVTLAGFSLALVACAPNQISKNCDQSSSAIKDQVSNTNAIKPIVQFDGTPSMQGFVNIPDSRYVRTLRLIDSAITTAFGNSPPVKYYKFGTKRIPLPNQQSSLIAQRPSFYDGNIEELLDAQIERAIEPLNKNNQDDLSIIITDLYQKDGEIRSVISSLKANYLEKGLAVGILAVRSEFDGIVYDIGLTYDFVDKTTEANNPETFSPFYLIVLGNYENVVTFFDRMKAASQSEGLNFSGKNFVIFYPKLLENPLVLNIKENNLSLKGMQKILTVNDGQLMVSVKDKQTTEHLMLKDEASDGQKMNYQIAYEKLPYLLPVKEFSVNVITEYNNSSRELKELAKLNQNQLIEFNDWQIKESELLFSTMFNYNQMEEGIYWFSAEVFPKTLGLPEWSSQWNLKEQETFNPSKSQTYNLLPFLEGLKATTLQQIKQKNQAVGRFCYLVYKP